MNEPRRPRLAVITMVYNEKILLPQFLRHYAPQVDTIFLLDNESDDGSIAGTSSYSNVEISTISTGGTLNDATQMKVKMALKRACIGKYDYVLLVDADEFVVPKGGGSLRQTLSGLEEREIFGTHGFNMFQGPLERPYNPSIPLLYQRQWGVESKEAYSKPIIVRPESSAEFVTGFHRLRNRENDSLKPPSPTFFLLLHYTGIDEELYVRRCMSRTQRLSEENQRHEWGVQYRGGTEQLFRERFRKASADPEAVRVVGNLIPAEAARAAGDIR